MSHKKDILMISKPISPPWNDSNKNLVRDLVNGFSLLKDENTCEIRAHIMKRKGSLDTPMQAIEEEIYPEQGKAFSPAIYDQLAVVRRLLLGRKQDIWHFFFTPNIKTSSMATILKRIKSMPTIHTVCSPPKAEDKLHEILFADKIAVLSKSTYQHFIDKGISSNRLTIIPPAVPHLERFSEEVIFALRSELGIQKNKKVLLYAGDYEEGSGSEKALEILEGLDESFELIMACRHKTVHAYQIEQDLKDSLSLEINARVHWVGESKHILGYIQLADVMIFPSISFYGKMDYPLVLLESMSLGTAVLVQKNTPIAELEEFELLKALRNETKDWVEEIQNIIKDPQKMIREGKRKRVLVQENFGIKNMASKYLDLYCELLKR